MNSSVASRHPIEGLLSLAVQERASATVISAEGELDMASAPELELLLDDQRGPVLLDLRSLRFIDSSGLRLLVGAEERSRRDGLDLRLVCGPATRRILELTGLTGHFSFADPGTLPAR